MDVKITEWIRHNNARWSLLLFIKEAVFDYVYNLTDIDYYFKGEVDFTI